MNAETYYWPFGCSRAVQGRACDVCMYRLSYLPLNGDGCPVPWKSLYDCLGLPFALPPTPYAMDLAVARVDGLHIL